MNVLLHDFLRTPRMQSHLASVADELSRLGLTIDGRRKADLRRTGEMPPSPYLLAHYDR